MAATILIIVGVIVIIALPIAFYKWGQSDPEFFFGLLSFLECCSMIGVFVITVIVTAGTFMLWHSLLTAGLVGVSTSIALVLVLSIAIALSRTENHFTCAEHRQ